MQIGRPARLPIDSGKSALEFSADRPASLCEAAVGCYDYRMNDEQQKSVRQLVRQGTRLLQQGRHQQAADVLAQAHAKAPDDFDAALNLSAAYVLGKQFKRAVPILETLAAQEPDNAMVWTNLGAAYLGNPVLADDEAQYKAVQAFTRALEIDPTAPSVAYNLGLIFKDRDEYHVAIRWFEIALRSDAGDRDAQYWINELKARQHANSADDGQDAEAQS